jgi:glycosidase
MMSPTTAADQPDLNWRNSTVRAAMYDVLRFWLDRGVDGFRVDAIWLLIKDAGLRDNPENPAYQPTHPEINRLLPIHNADQPEVHEVIAEMRSVLDRYDQRVLIGEIYLPIERLVTYYGKDLGGAHYRSIFNSSTPSGRRTRSRRWSRNTSARCRRAAGPIGCSAIMTSRGSQRGSGRSGRDSRPCCC